MRTDDICELLNEKIPGLEVLKNEPMKKHTSFKIGGNAEIFAKAKTVDEVISVLEICNSNNIPLNIIGNGSNLLVSDDGVKGIVLKICIDYINIQNDDAKHDNNDVIITAGSGVLLGKLAQILLKESISGFEFASGIPGTIGGAVRMNAGAYGFEFKDIVIETTAINKKGEIVKFSNEEQEFVYRGSIFKDKEYIIIETKLKLKHVSNSDLIKAKMDEYKQSRIEKQPLNFPSAGSTFKRGEDFITAKLIDDCGLKGYKVGGAEVSTKHAGFIINTGNAKASDIKKIIDTIKVKALSKYNVRLRVEQRLINWVGVSEKDKEED